MSWTLGGKKLRFFKKFSPCPGANRNTGAKNFQKEVFIMVFVGNAISLNMMLDKTALEIEAVSVDEVKKILQWELDHGRNFVSCVGHEPTAKLMSVLLGIEIPFNRASIKLQTWDTLLVFQVLTRLPEGAVLDEEALAKIPFKWYRVNVLPEWAGDAVSSVYNRGLF